MSDRWANVPLDVSPEPAPCHALRLTDGTAIGLPVDIAARCLRAEHGQFGHEALIAGRNNASLHVRWDTL